MWCFFWDISQIRKIGFQWLRDFWIYTSSLTIFMVGKNALGIQYIPSNVYTLKTGNTGHIPECWLTDLSFLSHFRTLPRTCMPWRLAEQQQTLMTSQAGGFVDRLMVTDGNWMCYINFFLVEFFYIMIIFVLFIYSMFSSGWLSSVVKVLFVYQLHVCLSRLFLPGEEVSLLSYLFFTFFFTLLSNVQNSDIGLCNMFC